MLLNIISVDDEYAAIVNLEYDLKQEEGIGSLVSFMDPLEALEYAKTHDVNVAFLDINMPVMSGIDLAVELKKLQPDLQLVFLSGEMVYEKEVKELGAIGYLFKPYMQEELEEILDLIRRKFKNV